MQTLSLTPRPTRLPEPEAIWLGTSTSLQQFDGQLLRRLSHCVTIARWDYCVTPDEASCLDTALGLLHDYLSRYPEPVHLMGHSMGGLMALLYAHPEQVRSLTLLAVGANPAITWHSHYYALRKLLPCSRRALLTQLAVCLFGQESPLVKAHLTYLLENDLDCAVSPHSLWRQPSIKAGGVAMPLMVCGSKDDTIVDPITLERWQPFMKEGDRLWLCPYGRHFFHYAHPNLVSRKIMRFWHSLEMKTTMPNSSSSITSVVS